MPKLFIILSLLIFSFSATARMYQWVDPETNTTQLSGKPPYWYRSGNPGPRVVVFDQGKVIDDTGITVSENENERLRQQALIIVEQDRLSALEKLRQAEMQRAAFGGDSEEEETVDVILEPLVEAPTSSQDSEEVIDESEIEQQMRELLDLYETLKTQNARELIESTPQ